MQIIHISVFQVSDVKCKFLVVNLPTIMCQHYFDLQTNAPYTVNLLK